MRIFALDTTQELLSLALGDGRRCWSWEGPGPHDERILPRLELLLKRAGWKIKDIDALAVANGPGRFTGIRIGMTLASILGKALQRPAVAISRFEALASRIKDLSEPVCVILPARQDRPGEFFLQTFAGKGGRLKPIGEPVWAQAAELPALWRRLPRATRLYGPAADEAARILGARVLEKCVDPAAAGLLAPARERLSLGRRGALLPLYLKPANFQKTA